MAEEQVVGGVAPSVRPVDAPKIQAIYHGSAWYRKALTGVSEPYPSSLFFLDRQGQWFTPFTTPGMTGPYDIRGWHKRP